MRQNHIKSGYGILLIYYKYCWVSYIKTPRVNFTLGVLSFKKRLIIFITSRLVFFKKSQILCKLIN